jgi:hypothetical protein
MWAIWSIEHQGWWPASRCGYVATLAEAGRFSHTEAAEIVARANIVECNECMVPLAALGLQDPPPSSTVTYTVALTPSQRMALLDCIAAVMVPPLTMDVFIDVVRDVETRPGDLLRLVMDARPTRG